MQTTLQKQIFAVSGMTCEACEYKIKHVLGKIDGVENVETELTSGQTTIETNRRLSLDELKLALKPHTKYGIELVVENQQTVANSQASSTESTLSTYYPLFLIFAFITVVAFLTADQTAGRLHNFMAGFFLVFSFFKLLNIKGFAESFAMYDLAAMRIPVYGKIYPFLELALGLLCLIHYEPKTVYWADIILMGFGNLGVISSVLDKKKIKCACLGTVFNLPMSTVTIIENTIMIAIGIVLLIIT